MTGSRSVVPVSDSDTLRETVAYAVRRIVGRAEETGESAEIHFVYPLSGRLGFEEDPREVDTARTLLDRVDVWADEDIEGEDDVTVETAMIGTSEYLFSPGDYADALVEYATDNDLGMAVFDPGFNPLGTTPLLPTLEAEVRESGLDVQEAVVTRRRRSSLLVQQDAIGQVLTLFGVSFLFYLALAGSVETFELVTGAITAGIVAVSLWGVSLTTPVSPGTSLIRLVRFVLYVPYLLVEIAKANLEIAYVVLHPDLPIDPEMVEFDAAVFSALPITMLANSITLTPGTLTVDVSKRHFRVHTLTKGSREDLFDGSIERAVRFVYYGRAAARSSSPRERGEDEQ